ncbi:hypothetical protein HWV62_13767 [Athelia sp. TMB]|nr:hypothetical protein HWV62_13767 [Athelia sp. TMB]
MYSIVQSCIVTILSCVWFAVHPNIPAPKTFRPRHSDFFARTILFLWHAILDQKQAAVVFVVSFLAPEWVLAWALRQLLVARKLVQQLEIARTEANETCKTATPEPLEPEGDDLDRTTLGSSTAVCTREHIYLTEDHLEYGQMMMAKNVARTSEVLKTIHAFFAIMGGYHFYSKTGPLHPLSPKNVIELVRRGYLVLPTTDELKNQSKGDALSKSIAIVQTLWFVTQCIARRIEHLPLTNLEVITLAYTVITVAMYIVWWDKPLNVICAVRVPEEEGKDEGAQGAAYESTWHRIACYVIGTQDFFVDLRQCAGVPASWAGDCDHDSYKFVAADVIALLVAMIFGAVHCMAWSYDFQSPLEQQLWRGSAVVIIIFPPALLVPPAMAMGMGAGQEQIYGRIRLPAPVIHRDLATRVSDRSTDMRNH